MKIDNSSLLEAGANCSCTQVSREANGLVTGVLLDLLPMTSVFSLNRFLGIQLNSQYPCGLLCFCLSLPCIGQDPEPHRLDTLPQMSHVTCHLSHVTCHMSNVTCHMSFEGLLLTGPTPSSLVDRYRSEIACFVRYHRFNKILH